MTRKQIVLVAAGVLLALAAFGAYRQVTGFQRKLGAAQALASSARAEARLAAQEREAVQAYVLNVEAQADSLRRLVERRRVSSAKTHVVLQTVPVPDTCQALVARWDSLAADLEQQRDLAMTRGDSLQHATDSLQTQLHADSAAAAALTAALQAQLKALNAAPGAGISFSARLIPHVYVGPQLGATLAGKPYAGVGVSIAWRVF